MANQVYVCGTLFHVYLSILWNRNVNRDGKSLLILHDLTPWLGELLQPLAKSGFFDEVIFVPIRSSAASSAPSKNPFSRLLGRKEKLIRDVERHFDSSRHDPFIRNAEINLFLCLGAASAYFVVKYGDRPIRMIEDGDRNYNSRLGYFKILKRKFLYRTFIGEGHDPEIREIHVQEPQRLLPAVRHKGRKLDLETLAAALTPEESSRLLGIFLSKPLDITPQGKAMLLITQPFSEDGYVSEAEKVEVFKGLIDQYGKGMTVYLKVHPRETTDYAAYLGDTIVLVPKSFPLELLNLFPAIRFDIGVTVYSSAINNVKSIEKKVFLGREYNPRLVAKKQHL